MPERYVLRRERRMRRELAAFAWATNARHNHMPRWVYVHQRRVRAEPGDVAIDAQLVI
jgi:hypothetical protein